MKSLILFLTDEETLRVLGFAGASAIFALAAGWIYGQTEHDDWAGMMLFFAAAGIALVLAVMFVGSIVINLVGSAARRRHESR